MSSPTSPTSPASQYGPRPPLAVLHSPHHHQQQQQPPYPPQPAYPISPGPYPSPYPPFSTFYPPPPPPPASGRSNNTHPSIPTLPTQLPSTYSAPRAPFHPPRGPTPLGLPLSQSAPRTPSRSLNAALTPSPSSRPPTHLSSEPSEYTDALSLPALARLAQNLGDDSLITRLTSDDSRHPVLFVHFTHENSPYFVRLRAPYPPFQRWLRRLFGMDSPEPVVLSNVDLPERARKKVKLLLYPWRAHYPTLDPSNPLQLPLLARTEEGGRLSRLLNSLGNGQTYALKPPLRLRDITDLALEAHRLTPGFLPESWKHRFFVWHIVFSTLDHFGHELYVTYRRSVHPDFVLGLQWDLKQYGSFSSLPVLSVLLGVTVVAYLPLWILLGFLFHQRGWDIGGILYLLIALPAGPLSPLPDYLLRLFSHRIRASSLAFRSRLTQEIRRQYAGHAWDEVRSTAQWSMSGPVGNINMHSPLFPYLSVNDEPTLPADLNLPPMDLRAFLRELKTRPALSGAAITAVQARQGRGSPFLKSYLLLFINLNGQDMALRLDPPAKKLNPLHPYEHTIHPSLLRLTSVAADDASHIIEDSGKEGSGSHILFTLNSWKTAFIDIDPKKPEQLISLAAQSRAAHRRLTSLTDVPSRLAEHPTPTLQDALRAVMAAHEELHPAYSRALFTLRLTLSVLRAFAIAYSNEYLPSLGDSKTPVHPQLFAQDPFVLQHHRAMIRHLNMLLAVLFYAMLIALAFVSPGDYQRYMVANTTIIVAALGCWFAWQRTFWPAWLGSVESGIDSTARWLAEKHLPRGEPLPRGAYFPPDEEKPAKPLNWDIPPTPLDSEFEAATVEWQQHISSRMGSSSRMHSSGLVPSLPPSSRFGGSSLGRVAHGGREGREGSAERREREMPAMPGVNGMHGRDFEVERMGRERERAEMRGREEWR